MDPLTIKPTSRDSAAAQDIVLRATTMTRLVFRPLLVNNANDENASVNGTFIFQKKGKYDEWEDISEATLATLKKGDGIQLHLHANELLSLYQHLERLYGAYRQTGIPRNPTDFVPLTAEVQALLDIGDEALQAGLSVNEAGGRSLFSRLLRWFLTSHDREAVLDSLESVDTALLHDLSAIAGIQYLREILRIWKDNESNDKEEFWQAVLRDYTVVLSQVFAHPVVILKDKAYLGGKSIANSGAKLVDFLVANPITQNAVLVELKTPMTQLLGTEYRDGVYSPSAALAGAVVQALNYRHVLNHNYKSLVHESEPHFRAVNPYCVVIAGKLGTLVTDSQKLMSFDLFRSSLSGVTVVTYDELFRRIEDLLAVLEGNLPVASVAPDMDDIPF